MSALVGLAVQVSNKLGGKMLEKPHIEVRGEKYYFGEKYIFWGPQKERCERTLSSYDLGRCLFVVYGGDCFEGFSEIEPLNQGPNDEQIKAIKTLWPNAKEIIRCIDEDAWLLMGFICVAYVAIQQIYIPNSENWPDEIDLEVEK